MKNKKKFSIDGITGDRLVIIINIAFGMLWAFHLLYSWSRNYLPWFSTLMLHIIVQCIFFYCSVKLYCLFQIAKALTEKKTVDKKEKNEQVK